MTVKRKIGVLVPVVLALLTWMLAAASPASAQAEPPAEEKSPANDGLVDGDSGSFVTLGGLQVQVTEIDDTRLFEASMSVTAQPGEGSPPAPSYASSSSAREVYFNNVLSANVGRAKWVRHYYAITQRVSGSGPYRAEAHATLIEGDSYGDEQVFSGYTHSCATVNVVNRTARTCASPKFSTSPGDKWFAISGHSYDRGNDGIVEKRVAGELDFVWTAPSR